MYLLIILTVHYGDYSNLCYRRKRRLPPFDVYERFSIHLASSPIARHYHIQVSHLSIGRATSPSFGAAEFRQRSASALLYLTQRPLRPFSRDFLRRSKRQGRNSFDNQYGAAFLWSSPKLLVGSVTVQLPTDPPLYGDNVFRTRRATYVCRHLSRPYVFSTRAREPLFAHRKSYNHFRGHVTHRLAGYIFTQLLNNTLITLHPQVFVRVLPPYPPSVGVPDWVYTLAPSEFPIIRQTGLSLYLGRDLWLHIRGSALCHFISEKRILGTPLMSSNHRD